MHTMQITCGNCAGVGKYDRWKTLPIEECGIGKMQKEEVVCQQCDGKGYIEYAVFTIKEAKAILKYCGLSTES